MPDVILNAFTGKIDYAGLSKSESDGLYIRIDGTSVTTARIPFAEGGSFTSTGSNAIIITAGKRLVFDGA